MRNSCKLPFLFAIVACLPAAIALAADTASVEVWVAAALQTDRRLHGGNPDVRIEPGLEFFLRHFFATNAH